VTCRSNPASLSQFLLEEVLLNGELKGINAIEWIYTFTQKIGGLGVVRRPAHKSIVYSPSANRQLAGQKVERYDNQTRVNYHIEKSVSQKGWYI